MGPWTRLGLSFLARNATANLARLARLAEVDAQWHPIAAAFRSDSMVHKLAPFALTRPAFTMRDALDAIGGTFASVNTAGRHGWSRRACSRSPTGRGATGCIGPGRCWRYSIGFGRGGGLVVEAACQAAVSARM
jgi:hypothetical protein